LRHRAEAPSARNQEALNRRAAEEEDKSTVTKGILDHQAAEEEG
jgi:hypothetical protein